MACQSICFSGLFDDKNKMTEEKWIYEVFIFIYTFYFIFFWEGGHSLCPFFYPRNWLKTSPSPTADKAFSKKNPWKSHLPLSSGPQLSNYSGCSVQAIFSLHQPPLCVSALQTEHFPSLREARRLCKCYSLHAGDQQRDIHLSSPPIVLTLSLQQLGNEPFWCVPSHSRGHEGITLADVLT